jgi:N utilization substance protein B
MDKNIPKNNLNHLPLKKSFSRLMATQILYQNDFYKNSQQENIDIDALAEDLLESYLLSENDKEITSYRKKVDVDLLKNLLSGTLMSLSNLDEKIKSKLKDAWTIEQLPDVMLQILRLGVFELKFMKDTPSKVIISEYVDLAACFYDAKKITFVNSLLQNIANER